MPYPLKMMVAQTCLQFFLEFVVQVYDDALSGFYKKYTQRFCYIIYAI